MPAWDVNQVAREIDEIVYFEIFARHFDELGLLA